MTSAGLGINGRLSWARLGWRGLLPQSTGAGTRWPEGLAAGDAMRRPPPGDVRQKPLTLRRPPVTVLPDSDGVATTLLRIAALMVEALAPGFAAA